MTEKQAIEAIHALPRMLGVLPRGRMRAMFTRLANP